MLLPLSVSELGPAAREHPLDAVKTILYIVDSLGLSGKTRTLVHLASHLDPQRFRSAVCTFSDEKSILTEHLAAHGVPVYTLPCRSGLDLSIIPKLAKLIRSTKADILQCYNPRPILYGGLAGKLLGGRGSIGILSAFACQVPDRTYTFLPQPLSTNSRRNVYRNRLAYRLMHYLVTVSPSLGKRFCQYNGIPTDKLRTIPYGADLSAVDRVTADEAASLRQQIGFGPDEVVIGSVGRLVEQKDYPTQLKAFAQALHHAPELRMVLAGDGPLADSLRKMVQDLGIEKKVRFLGHWEQVPCLLRSLDIFVLSSKFEPFGVALLEAKAAGIAIVATRVNEIPEILSDDQSGLLSPPEDPDSLGRLFVRLAKDPALRAHLGQAARKEANERHSLDAIGTRYDELYDSLTH